MENSVMGMINELPPPAAVPLMFMVGPPEGCRRHTTDVHAAFAQAFHQTAGSGAFAFTQRGGGDGGHLDVLAIRFVFQPINNFKEIQLAQSSHGQDLVLFQGQFLPPLLGGRHVLFGCFGNLPVSHFYCIVSHVVNPPSSVFG